jgi:hypothetical protein
VLAAVQRLVPERPAAPMVLNERVTAADPLNVVPEAAPEPLLFMVKAFGVLPVPHGLLAVPSIPAVPACTQFPGVRAESVTLDTVIAGDPESPPEVPVVFWLNVGKLVRLAALNTGDALKVGAAEDPVKLPNTVFAAAELSV